MSRNNSTLAIIALSITILVLALMPKNQSQPSVQVVTVNEAVTLTEQQRITLFINELLDAKSARCLKNILTVESHMNPKAKNPTSTARGVGQLLDTTYKNIGLKHSADPLAQVIATIAYISRHFGSTCSAWDFHKKHNYY
jgi:Transglycosylase SLT domain